MPKAESHFKKAHPNQNIKLVIPIGLYSDDSCEFWIMGYIKTGFHLIDEQLFGLGVTDEWDIVCEVHTISHFPSGSNFSDVRIV